jgi:hypothetical protein
MRERVSPAQVDARGKAALLALSCVLNDPAHDRGRSQQGFLPEALPPMVCLADFFQVFWGLETCG